MKIIFLTLLRIEDIETESSIYADLMRKFVREGHNITIVHPNEKRLGLETQYIQRGNVNYLRVRTGNITKSRILEKGIATLMLEFQFRRAISKYLNNEKFDLILYATPPITFYKAISYVKKRDGASTYLMLKDIFPQNAVDLGLLKKEGISKKVYQYFRNKEIKLYEISDIIGCMSPANLAYIASHNQGIINSEKLDICPNSIEVADLSISKYDRQSIREQYNLPIDKKIFIYGGNFGKPQDVDFILSCIDHQKTCEDFYFVFVGSGTEFYKVEDYSKKCHSSHLKVLSHLPKSDFDRLVSACDVGMIFLNKNFTIPNFPSRLLTYMQAKLPVYAITDKHTDIGDIIMSEGFGKWVESSSVEAFSAGLAYFHEGDRNMKMGENAFEFLKKNYNVEEVAPRIIERIQKSDG